MLFLPSPNGHVLSKTRDTPAGIISTGHRMRFTWRGRISGTDYEAQIPSPQRNNGVNLRLTLTMSETKKETPVTRNRKEECLNSEKRGR